MVRVFKRIWHQFEKILYKIVYKAADIFHIEMSENKWNTFLQLIKFSFVGVSNTAISYITYLVVCLIGFNFHIGNILGFVVSVLNSFYWNNKYVFSAHEDEQRTWWKALVKTFISYAFSGLILTELLLILWIEILHVSQFIAPLINLVITIPINFFMNKLWAFKVNKRRE